jgi:uncharacterized protein YggT (Ycf19 family)
MDRMNQRKFYWLFNCYWASCCSTVAWSRVIINLELCYCVKMFSSRVESSHGSRMSDSLIELGEVLLQKLHIAHEVFPPVRHIDISPIIILQWLEVVLHVCI